MKTKFTLLCFLSGSLINAQVGIGTTSPNSTLDVRGSLSYNNRVFTTSITALSTDNILVFTGTAATTVTLPDATSCNGREYWIKNASTTLPVPALTVSTTSSQTINNNSSWLLDEPYEIVKFISNGTNWYVLNQDVIAAKTSSSGGGWLQGGNRLTSARSIGSVTNYDLPFVTNNSEKMRLTTGGYLGIGTTSPGALLNVKSANAVPASMMLAKFEGIQNAGSGNYVYTQISNNSSTNTKTGMIFGGNSFSRMWGIGNDIFGDNKQNFWIYDFNTWSTRFYIDSAGRTALGTISFDASNPEKLIIDAGSTTSVNLIKAKGSINNYLQFNIQNQSTGAAASSDIVATADNGTETSNYVNFGINGSAYTGGIMGASNDAYLYNLGQNLLIGTGSESKSLVFMTGGTSLSSNERMRIDGSGNVGVGTTAPNSTFSLNGSLSIASKTISGNYTILSTDCILINTGGAATWTLPDPTTCQNRIYRLLNHGTGSITITPAFRTTSSSTVSSLTYSPAGSNLVEVISDGTQWRRIN